MAVSKISILTVWRVKTEIHIFFGMFFVKEKKIIIRLDLFSIQTIVSVFFCFANLLKRLNKPSLVQA